MINDDRIANAFSALAHPRRVRLFRLLCEQPELGLSMISLQTATGIKDAPLLHHLRIMERAGLVTRRRTGAFVRHTLKSAQLAGAMRAIADLQNSAVLAVRPTR
jgi:DNA-binding transcriptional ArsR family regulator